MLKFGEGSIHPMRRSNISLEKEYMPYQKIKYELEDDILHNTAQWGKNYLTKNPKILELWYDSTIGPKFTLRFLAVPCFSQQ